MSNINERNISAVAQSLDGHYAQLAEQANRIVQLENTILTMALQIKQLQDLFATRTVPRDTGATTE